MNVDVNGLLKMPSIASTRFRDNRKDIDTLWTFRKELQRGRRRESRLEVLHRAAMVFIAACWESYVEDVAAEAFDFLLHSATTPDVFPNKVKVLASRELFEDQDERRIWELVTGWKDILKAHRDAILRKSLRGFNTPKTQQVKELFTGLLDLDVTLAWTWQDISSEVAANLLDEYMTIRGNIAHRTKHDDPLHKTDAKLFLTHVALLVETTDDAVMSHLQSLTGVSPW
jgi:hypothetical protein